MRPGDGMSEPDLERVEKFAEAIQAAADRHGVTHTEDWHPEAYAAMALADKEHARLIAEVEALRRVVRGSGESRREAEDRAEAAEAEVARLRISPDHLEELLGIDPNDPLNKLARYGVEQRRRAEDAEAEVERLRALVESAEQKANDYHEEILAAHADRDRLAQALWDTWAALGHDTDGDTGPGAFIAGMGYDGFAAMVVKDAATFREESESDYDIDTSELKAEIERYRTLHESVRAQANVALVAERAKLAGTLDKVRKFAEDVRSHPPITPTTTGEEMLSIRLQRWFADDLEATLEPDPFLEVSP